jgi:hypothetical protein
VSYIGSIRIIGRMPPLWDALQAILPKYEENLLLKVCAGDSDQAAKSWHAWTAIRPDLRAAIPDGMSAVKPLLPLLHFRLTNGRVPLDQLTATVLRAATIWEERRSERIREILAECLDVLTQVSVTPILLNEIALAETAYPRPSLRHCHNVDLLISASDVLQARKALGRCGFSSVEPEGKPERNAEIRMVHVDGLRINLHLSLLSGCAFSLSEMEMRGRVIFIPFGGRSATILSPTDMLLHLCGRFAEGRLYGLTWVTDADGLIRRSSLTDSDRDFLLLMARSGGLSLPLFVMLYYLRTEMVASIPDEVLERLAAQARRAPVLYRDAVLAGAHQPTIAAMQAPKRLETKTGL